MYAEDVDFVLLIAVNPFCLMQMNPERVAKAIKEWGLRYVVITSVCRDDLEDGGSEHIAKTINAIKLLCPTTIVESLIPDFRGDESSIKEIVKSQPEVISHNIETILDLLLKLEMLERHMNNHF